MTEKEIKTLKTLEWNLTYGRGIAVSEWATLESLRIKKLKQEGKNPAEYNLNCAYLSRKKSYTHG